MKTNDNATHAAWNHWMAELPWNPKHAEESANLALSKAYWLGMERGEAIAAILKLPAASFLRENRHILLSAWNTIDLEMRGYEFMPVEIQPTHNCAA